MKYAKKAAWWLRPLLERYFEKRKLIGVSEYLFVGRYQLTQNKPVCDTQILDLLQRASQRVLDGVVNPRDLRNTAAALTADRSKRRGAILTRLGYTRGWATRFNYLEPFLLEPKTTPRRKPNRASPQRGRSGESGARCAERASEAGARGRINKVRGRLITAILFGSAARRCSWENRIFCYQMTVLIDALFPETLSCSGLSQMFFLLRPRN